MKRAAAALSLLFLPALLSCDGDPIGPGSQAGVYVLQNTPVVLETPSGAHFSILADTLYLGADPITRRVVYAFEGEAGPYEAPVTEEYRARLRFGRIELEIICPPNALCTPPPHLWGVPGGAGLILRAQIDPGVPLYYSRISFLRVLTGS